MLNQVARGVRGVIYQKAEIHAIIKTVNVILRHELILVTTFLNKRIVPGINNFLLKEKYFTESLKQLAKDLSKEFEINSQTVFVIL